MCLNYEYDTINKNYYIPFLLLQFFILGASIVSVIYISQKNIKVYSSVCMFW